MSKIFSISYTKNGQHHHQPQHDYDSDNDDSRSIDSGDSATAIRIKRFPFEAKSPKKEIFVQKVDDLTPKHLKFNQAIKDARNLKNWLDRTCIALKGYIKSKTEKRSESLGSCDSIGKYNYHRLFPFHVQC